MIIKQDPVYSLIAEIRNRSLCARYTFKRLRDKKINEVQAIIDFGKELDKIDKVLADCEKEMCLKED